MEIEDYLNSSFSCSCGREHKVPIREIVVEEDALLKVPEIMKELTDKSRLYIIGDKNTFGAAGSRLAAICRKNDYKVNKVILEGEHVVPDPDTLFKILEKVEADGYMVACGSGTINDITRYLSYKLNKPYTIVGTAPSMDGYASSVAPLTVDGVKKTYNAAPPEAIIADLDVLKDAPWRMIQSGFGDLLGKYTSLLDWKLSKILLNEYYCAQAERIVREELTNIMEIGSELKDRSRESIKVLTKGLIKSGLAMLMVESSRPASGSEHHFSHFLELYGSLFDQGIPSHGNKVGLGTYFTSSLYLKLSEVDFSRIELNHDRSSRKEDIKEIYGERAEPVIDNLNERWKNELISEDRLEQKEDKIKKLIRESSKSLENVRRYLDQIGILEREDVRALDTDWIKKGLKFGFEIRNRYTISTLLRQAGLLENWSDEMVDSYCQKVL
ncbi:MAG: sn-glycerol-1-phosphate dehydrogenase [Candidatus Bipolaricaulota bacterium]